jgi:hypothetical protein
MSNPKASKPSRARIIVVACNAALFLTPQRLSLIIVLSERNELRREYSSEIILMEFLKQISYLQ